MTHGKERRRHNENNTVSAQQEMRSILIKNLTLNEFNIIK